MGLILGLTEKPVSFVALSSGVKENCRSCSLLLYASSFVALALDIPSST
jgi:hypothetical protein